jgi:sugar/nucleoside kinase (ribokinase family)
MYDILCYGSICADQRIYLPRFPQPGDGMRIISERWTPGGNALNEAVALAGWGRRVALCGDRIGADAPGEVVWAGLRSSAVDSSHLQRDPAWPTVVCRILITPDGERTILVARASERPFDLPSAELVAASQLVSLSRYGPGGALAVAQLARAADRSLLVSDLSDPADPLAALADTICVSAAALHRQAGGGPIGPLVAALHRLRGATVLVSDGPRAAQAFWAEGGAMQSATATPPTISARDTVGAGDTFRAAVAHGLIAHQPWPAILAHAVEAASAICT